MISCTDPFGVQRAKLLPAQAIAGMQAEEAGFKGFATWPDLTPAHPDMLAMPDPAAAIQLPRKPEVARVPAHCVMADGPALDQAPRNVLARLVGEAAGMGLEFMTGVEPEFVLLTPDGHAISDAADTAPNPCYDRQAVMRRYDVIAEVCDPMLTLGLEPCRAARQGRPRPALGP